jgi:vitamin B12 transporter
MARPVLMLCCAFLLPCVVPCGAAPAAIDDAGTIYYADEIVVTASRIQWPIEKTASSITVITKDDIRKFQTDSIVDILRSVVGADVIQAGSAGKTSSVFLRGSNSNHCLVMMNGVPLNDPTTGAYDLSDLVAGEVERIEVVRGHHGILYGSQAIGGVINIITDTGHERMKRRVSLAGGSFETAAGSAGVSGSNDGTDYSFTLSRITTEGRFPNDFYKNTSFTGTVSSRITDDSHLSLLLKYNDAGRGLRGPSFDVDPNATQNGGTFLIAPTYRYYANENWNFYLRTSFYTNEITFDDPIDPLESGPFAGDIFTEINSDVQNVTWQNNLRFFDDLWIISGIDWKRERTTNSGASPFGPTSFDSKITNLAWFLNAIFDFTPPVTASAGVRVDRHSEFGDVATYKLSLSAPIHVTGTVLKGSIGSGFRAPSLNELYYPGYGNPELLPEKTVGFDAGISQRIERLKLSLEADYFRNDYENMISYNLETFLADNIGESLSSGIELGAAFSPAPSLTLRGFYTYLRTEDVETGKQLLRRPRHSGGVSIAASAGPFDLLITSAVVGTRLDNDFGGPLGEYWNASYTRHDAALTYHYGEAYEVFARVGNVLDERYDEIAGYPSPGIQYTAGTRVTF